MATFDDPEFFGEHWADIYNEGGDLDPLRVWSSSPDIAAVRSLSL